MNKITVRLISISIRQTNRSSQGATARSANHANGNQTIKILSDRQRRRTRPGAGRIATEVEKAKNQWILVRYMCMRLAAAIVAMGVTMETWIHLHH